MKIYTKQGDEGKTSLWGGERVAKDHQRLKAYGSLDELNSFVGLLISELSTSELNTSNLSTPEVNLPELNLMTRLKSVQEELFQFGSQLATPNEKDRSKLPSLSDINIEALEKEIDEWTRQLPALKSFILPGGSKPASLAHVCRTICRRAERELVTLLEVDSYPSLYLRYLNRLSDYFFVLARFANHAHGVSDELWSPSK